MRTFKVIREVDETGVSGTGVVVEGVIFSDGECVTRWVTEASHGRSTSIWDNYASFAAIHVIPHPDNKTKIIFDDGEVHDGVQRIKKARKKKETADAR